MKFSPAAWDQIKVIEILFPFEDFSRLSQRKEVSTGNNFGWKKNVTSATYSVGVDHLYSYSLVKVK